MNLGPLKTQLAAKLFATDANLNQAVTSCLKILDTNFFYVGIQALMPRWDKFLNINGYYVEVCCVLSAPRVSRILRSQNDVVGGRELVTLLFENPLYLKLHFDIRETFHFIFMARVSVNVDRHTVLDTRSVKNKEQRRTASSDLCFTQGKMTKLTRNLGS